MMIYTTIVTSSAAPNGLAKLTDFGKLREFRIGLEYRKLYKDYSLHEKLLTTSDSATVQAWIYNKEEAKYLDIIYRPIELGRVCRGQFKSKHPTASEEELEAFYPTQFDID